MCGGDEVGKPLGFSYLITSLNKTKKYLQTLHDETIDVLKNDIPIEEALKSIAQSERSKWVLFDRVNPGNIVRTFMRYEWEY